jgi:hypothetical protein
LHRAANLGLSLPHDQTPAPDPNAEHYDGDQLKDPHYAENAKGTQRLADQPEHRSRSATISALLADFRQGLEVNEKKRLHCLPFAFSWSLWLVLLT